MFNSKDLSLLCIAIGSLPHTNLDEAMDLMSKNFKEVPFWPQLFKLNKNEDMTVQFTEKIPAMEIGKDGKPFINYNSDRFTKELEQLNQDFQEVITNNNDEVLEKYALTLSYSSTFQKFIKIVKETKPKFAKGQISGSFTQALNLKTENGEYAFCINEINTAIKKVLTLNALWQIKEIKKASSSTMPIIFQDEPTLSVIPQWTINKINIDEIMDSIREISDYIKSAGAISAVHCCGNTDWGKLLNTQPNIINFDAYEYSEKFCKYPNEINNFLKNGGIVAFGIVPTLNSISLQKENLDTISEKFYNVIKLFINKGVDKELLAEQLLITPACGAGSLSIELAEKAIQLANQLTELVKEKGMNIDS